MIISHKASRSLLAGYYKNDRLYAMLQLYKKDYGIEECMFLFENDRLVFVSKKQICNKAADSNIAPYQNYQAMYLLCGKKIIRQQTEGAEKEELVAQGDPYPFGETNTARYYWMLAELDKYKLMKRKNMDKLHTEKK